MFKLLERKLKNYHVKLMWIDPRKEEQQVTKIISAKSKRDAEEKMIDECCFRYADGIGFRAIERVVVTKIPKEQLHSNEKLAGD